jgi:hypothetical protein
MRRIVSAVVVCAAVGATAAPAMAWNTGNQPPGPPALSGGPPEVGHKTTVVHCTVFFGTNSVVVFNPQGVSGGGTCGQL